MSRERKLPGKLCIGDARRARFFSVRRRLQRLCGYECAVSVLATGFSVLLYNSVINLDTILYYAQNSGSGWLVSIVYIVARVALPLGTLFNREVDEFASVC